MSRVFWDTNLFIYLLENDPHFFPPTAALRRRMMERSDELVTSAMTLGEVQVKPRRLTYYDRADKFCRIISETCTIVPFTEQAAKLYAQIRENPAVRAPDAIQLSCAAVTGIELFITNDRRLQKLQVPGIHFITSLDRVPI